MTAFSMASLCTGQESAEPAAELSRYELAVKYAETRMQLAEVELRWALDMNQSIPGAIPKIRVERLRSNLVVAKEQFNEATLASSGGPERVRLVHAEEKIRLARLDFETGERMRNQGMITALELERLRLKYELAKLNVEVLKNPDSFVTLLNYIEAKVDRMGDEILALDERISKLEPSRGMLLKNP
jgi:multidrug resistance efflux pump